ncbi:MAG: hypothetical protein K0R25_177 [Rickettsiaceae bacterium]|jgi:hypothetical protein|nr:hypothetical protein [Rickettsiaceae bacterium]
MIFAMAGCLKDESKDRLVLKFIGIYLIIDITKSAKKFIVRGGQFKK